MVRQMNIDNISSAQNIARLTPSNDDRAPNEKEGSGSAAQPQDSVNLEQGATGAPKKELTMLFYMHGQYKDLHKSTASAFFNIEKAGSDDNVNVVVQLGRAPQDDPSKEPQKIDGDWSGVKRYLVTKHDHSDMDMTLEQFIEIEKKIPDNPVIHYMLGDCYQAQGDKEKALAEYNRSKELGMVKYMNDYESDKSKKIREEVDGLTKPFEDAGEEKQVFGSPALEQLPDGTKMGDPQTLKDFVSWGMKSYPANHYVVVVTGHGGAWIGALEMTPESMNKALKEGTEEASKATGEPKKLDALLFNSCYMGNMEAAYEMRGASDINIASENYSRGNMLYDWDDHINSIEKKIKESGEFDAKAFAKDFVEYYRKEGKEVKDNYPEFTTWKESYLTLTAIDNKNLDGLVAEWKNFIAACKDNKVPDHLIFKDFSQAQGFNSSAFNPAQTIFAFYDMIKDIGDIMAHVKENPMIPQPVKDEAGKVQEAVKSVVIDEQHEGKAMDNATGITVWAPSNAVDVAYMAGRYEKENVPQFVKSSGGYLEWLKEAARNVNPEKLKAFMADTQLIRNIKLTLENPDMKLTDREKKTLEDAKESITKHALKIKEDLDLTEPRLATLWKNPFKTLPDFGQYGTITEGFVREAAQRDGLSDTPQR
jgi:hypothetical protein